MGTIDTWFIKEYSVTIYTSYGIFWAVFI